MPGSAPSDAAMPWGDASWPGEPSTGRPASWYPRFAAAWDRARAAEATVTAAGPEVAGGAGGLGLLEVARPLIEDARQRLRDTLPTGLPAALASLPDLLAAQPPLGWLGMCLTPTMALELAVAREQGRLSGDGPAERYGSFVRALADRSVALAMWRRYPVLARQAAEILGNWVAARAAFARHLAADLTEIEAALTGGGDLGVLTGVRFGAAETHRGGRSVAVVSFAGGTVVYKPRSLAIDCCFDRLLSWINSGAPQYRLRRLALLDRGDRGWVEHVAAAPCDPAQMPAYFWRLGALLALAYLVHGFDLHADNLIAVSGDPVIVDLEALFHTEQSQPGVRAARLGDPAAAMLAESVLVAGLLPGPLVVPDVETGRWFGTDISPMSVTPSRRTLIRIPVVEADGTDLLQVRYCYRSVPAPAGRLAVTGGGAVSPDRFRAEFVSGFTSAYQRLASAGERLLNGGGPLAGCAEVPVRLVQLSTFLYVRLLLDSWHPDFQREAAQRDRCLSRLAAGWKGVPHRADLVAAEHAALRRGDVPVFVIKPGHRAVWLEDGTRLAGVLGEPPLDAVRRRLRRMGPGDLAFQVSVIDSALAAAAPPPASAISQVPAATPPPAPAATPPPAPAATPPPAPTVPAIPASHTTPPPAPAVSAAPHATPPPAPAVSAIPAPQTSAASAPTTTPPAASPTSPPPAPATVPVPAKDLLAAAQQVAERLAETAVRADGRIGWITTEVVDEQHRRVTHAGLDLYGGLPGIGLFLSYLAQVADDGVASAHGRVAGDRMASADRRVADDGVASAHGQAGADGVAHPAGRVADLAVEVADEVADRCLAAAALGPPPRGTGLGAFGALLGPVYYLAHAAAVHRLPRYAQIARRVLLPAVSAALAAGGTGATGPAGKLGRARRPGGTGQPDRPAAAEPAGVADGLAGCVLALLALHAVTGDAAEIRLASAAARRLAKHATGEPGLGYGDSGVALALARLHAVTGDSWAAAAACALVLAEPGTGADAGWCQGAAGAGLVRLELLRRAAYEGIRAELERGLGRCAGTVAAGLAAASDDAVCHGRLGMIEMLAAVADTPPERTGVAAGRRMVGGVLAEIVGADPGGWRLALPGPVPGLLPGLAGIGLCLVRLACPEKVPQILLFAPPGGVR